MQYTSVYHPESGIRVRIASFQSERGAREIHLSATTNSNGDFERQLGDLEMAYLYALRSDDIPLESALFRRLFVSDYANQSDALKESPLVNGSNGLGPAAVSVVQQPPLPDSKLGLWAYHMVDFVPLDKEKLGASGVSLRRGGLVHCWSVDMSVADTKEFNTSANQTARLFGNYCGQLDHFNATLAENAIRTWLFVQNVDVNYAGMVEARKALFKAHGLTENTHYITSTGIEGRHADPERLVLFDAYAIAGMESARIAYLNAPQQLGPTHVYGVTFERGVRVAYGDRNHIMIAGTASIEPSGKTIHKGDINKQTIRAFENVAGLLADAGAAFSDVAQMIVYLRDPADRKPVQAFLDKRFPHTPCNLVLAPVCRPDWLIEVECMAIAKTETNNLPRF